jgi:hypothetical protein
MAQLAIAGFGGMAGAGIAGTMGMTAMQGASFGWMAGSILGRVLFPGPDQRIEGPRQTDLTVQSSAYGAAIPIGWGTWRQAGNVIWSAGIKEVSREEEVGGKGGPSVTNVSYSYFWTGAVAIAQGEIDGVIRIWADSKIIYDVGVSDLSSPPSDDEASRYWKEAKAGVVFRLYKGTMDQMPDGIIEAKEGEGNVSAHRGLCYLVFDDLPLADYGNRVPQFSFEVTRSGTPSSNVIINNEDSADEKVLYAYPNSQRIGYSKQFGWAIWDMATMKEKRYKAYTDIFETFPSAIVTAQCHKYLYGFTGETNRGHYTCVDPETLTELSTWGSGGIATWNTEDAFTGERSVAGNEFLPPIAVFGAYEDDPGVTAQLETFMCALGQFGTLGILKTTGGILQYHWGAFKGVGNSAQGPGVGPGERGFGYCDFYALGYGGGFSGLYFNHLRTTSIPDDTNGGSGGTTHTQVSVPTTSIDPAGGNPTSGYGPHWDMETNTVSCTVLLNSRSYFVNFDTAGNINYATPLADYGFPDNTSYYMAKQEDPYSKQDHAPGTVCIYSVFSSDWIIIMDIASGRPLQSWSGLDSHDNHSWGGSYWRHKNTALFQANTGDGNGLRRIMPNRLTGSDALLSDILTDLCAEAGYGPSDIDVSDHTATNVPGYELGRAMNITEAIRPLAQAYEFDGVETDFKIKFPARGGASVASITESKLLADRDPSKGPIETSRGQEVEQPVKVTLSYLDRDNDYQQLVQESSRQKFPNPTMQSSNIAAISVPLIERRDKMAQLAETMLYRAWQERTTYASGLGPEYLGLDPADPITITMNDGRVISARIVRTTMSSAFSVKLELISEDAETYNSSAVGGDGLGIIPQVVPGDPDAKLFVLDVPLLRDGEAVARTVPIYYFSMAGWSETPEDWPSGILFRSTDGLNYSQVQSSSNGATWGIVTSALADIPDEDFNGVDYTNTFRVAIYSGANNLASVTLPELMSGNNVAALFKANGEVEIIGFQNVTSVGTDYEFSALLRGQRGTDTMAYNHAIGDEFLVLDTNTARVFGGALTDNDNTQFYKGVGQGQYLEEITAQDIASNMRSLMPYRPSKQKVTLSGSNLVFDWLRRTRVGGAWVNGTGTVPLSEDSEAYEIDIYDSTQTTVIRAVTGLTASTYTYLEADILSDFGLATTSHTGLSITGDMGFEDVGAASDGLLLSLVPEWIVADGNSDWRYRTSPVRTGSFSVRGANFGQQDIIYQEWDLSGLTSPYGLFLKIDAGVATYSWDIYGYGSAGTGRIEAQWLDKNKVEIQLDQSAAITAASWSQYTVSGTIPAGARYVRWRMREHGGATTNFDDWTQPTITSPAWGVSDLTTIDAEIFQVSTQAGRGFSIRKKFSII